jgi:osmoprotectant transport system permease protein
VIAQAPESEPLIRWDWVASHVDELAERLRQHLSLTVIAVLGGFVIASLLTAIARRWRWSVGPITAMNTVLYAIPSIALFAALIPWFGVGMSVPAIALTTYSLVVLTPFMLTVFDSLDPAVLSAAEAMGMSRSQRLWRVEIPLALPGVAAAIRIATVTVIGLVTVGGLFGLGGFGNLINDGLIRDFPTPIVLGIAGSVLLALIADGLILAITWMVTPWERSNSASSTVPR